MNAPLTAARLSEIRARAEAATDGPWVAEEQLGNLVIRHPYGGSAMGWDFVGDSGVYQCDDPYDDCSLYAATADIDAAFIAAARQDVPDLLAEVDRLTAALDIAEKERDEARSLVDPALEQGMEAVRQKNELEAALASDRAKTAAAIRALTAQVVERDAVIEQVREWKMARQTGAGGSYAALARILDQPPRDALAARDAVRDKTVRATALRDFAMAEASWLDPEFVALMEARADQEEGKTTNGDPS